VNVFYVVFSVLVPRGADTLYYNIKNNKDSLLLTHNIVKLSVKKYYLIRGIFQGLILNLINSN